MKHHLWTAGLVAAGVINLASVAEAEEAKQSVMTALSSTTLSGYVDTSAIWKPGTGNNLVGRSYDGAGKQDGINLDAIKISLSKPLSEGSWSAGYTIDLMYGADATPATPAAVAAPIRQAYVTLRAPIGNGLDFKLGAFDTILGYESIDSVNNPNFSRSYGFFLEPTSHAGVLASYQVADWLSVSAGIANSYNGFGPAARTGSIPAESEKTYMGSLNFTAPESFGFAKGATLALGVVDGLGGGVTDTTSLCACLTVPTPLESLKVGSAFDYRLTGEGRGPKGNALLAGGNDSTYAWALAGYASYKATEKLTLNTRIDWANASDGTFYNSAFNPVKPFIGAANNDPRNELLGTTVTVDYALWANVVTRAEFRWDTALAGGSNDSTKPFGVVDKNALSLALNVIYKF